MKTIKVSTLIASRVIIAYQNLSLVERRRNVGSSMSATTVITYLILAAPFVLATLFALAASVTSPVTRLTTAGILFAIGIVLIYS